jgi:hypothetical protein
VISSVMVARSSVARHAAPVPPASPLVTLSAACGASSILHCDHYGRDGHVEAFCYRKKKAHAHCFSQGTGGSSSGGSERSSAGSKTHELLMLFHCLVDSTSSGAVGSVTQSPALKGSGTTS